jgi:hydrophobic/amphiphilic exporter-1 (mainly G- bacteria), HAE1 family
VKFTEFSVRNALIVAAVTMAVAFLGLYAYASMGVGITPNISFPLVIITTTDAGADPATIESQITKPIEDAVAALPNIDTITSTSSDGVSSVAIQFTTAANSELAPVDVERIVNSARGKLPAEADPPSITKFETSAFPVLTVAASGPQPLVDQQRVATDTIERAFSAVPGVQSVQTSGGDVREVQIQVDPDKLRAYGLGLNTLQLALQADQIQAPAGLLTSAGKDVTVRLNALVTRPDQLAQIAVATTDTGIVHLGDVATIGDGVKRTQTINRLNGASAVTLVVTKTASANTLAVSKGVREAMTSLQPVLPEGMKLDVVNDAATYTQQSFDTIRKTLVEAIVLTGLILLLFLHTLRGTVIVLIAIPTSVLTTFALMNVMGMNLNLFSMLALTLSVGILVDDSIVVLENIYRHLSMGEPPLIATLNGRREIGLAALTITMVDVVVYVPIALISGIAGDFIRPFALVVAAATLTSLVVSFTLTPLLASHFLTQQHALAEGKDWLTRFGRTWDKGFDWLELQYERLLRALLTRNLLSLGFVGAGMLRLTRGRVGRRGPRGIGLRWAAILVGFVAAFAGVALLGTGLIGLDIFPSGDQSEVDLSLTMPPATSIDQTYAAVQVMEQKLKSVPEVREVYSSTGGGSTGFGVASGDTSQITVLLVPKGQRTRSSADIADEFNRTLPPGIPKSRLNVSLPNAFGFGGFGGQPIQVAIQGPDPTTLNRLVDEATAHIAAVPGAADVNNSNQQVQPEYVLEVNRSQSADLGVTPQQAATALHIAVDGQVVTKFHQLGRDDVDIRLISNDAFRSSPLNLPTLPILSSTGGLVQLGQLGTIVPGTAATQIAHVARERSVTISASASGRLVGDVLSDVQARLRTMALPVGYSITYSGQAAQGGDAFADIFKALGVAVLLMYLLMLMLFRSVTVPLAVLMSLPLAIVGALGAMALTRSPFTLFSLLGIAVLVGLVGKNAILLVDYTDTLRKRGMDRTAALLHAAPTRLRPILMTTFSIIASLTPVGLGLEEGSELLKSAAVVLIGGLLTSTLLTLVFVPAMYTIFDDIQEFVVGIVRRIAPPRQLQPEELAILQPGLHPTTNGVNGVSHHPDVPKVPSIRVDR